MQTMMSQKFCREHSSWKIKINTLRILKTFIPNNRNVPHNGYLSQNLGEFRIFFFLFVDYIFWIFPFYNFHCAFSISIIILLIHLQNNHCPLTFSFLHKICVMLSTLDLLLRSKLFLFISLPP